MDATRTNTYDDVEKARRQAESFRLPFEPLERLDDDPGLWADAPLELMVRYGCVPVGRSGARLVLAFGGLDDLLKVDEVEFQLGRPIDAVVAPQDRVAEVLKRHRGGELLLEQASESLRLQLVGDDESEAELQTLPAESPIVRLVDSLILGAIDRRASDIHIETKDREVLAKYRIDGVLYPALEPLDKRHHGTIISRIKVMSELDIAEKRVPQDGRFRLRAKGRTIDFRVSIMPSIHGEDAVIRVLDKESLNTAFRNLRLDVLGFAEPELRKLRKYITEPYGMVVVTGPTGSGKTTTLYASLSEIASPEDKIITIEDPVEYQIPLITQVPVNEKKGLTFARGLRSILRHDPDKIMVGEVRDPETAQIAVQSALTGHLVFTTVHANNVFDVIGRFIHMGVEPYNFVSALNCVLAQRLVRVLCPSCRRRVPASEEPLRESGLDPDLYQDQVFWEAVGCDACAGAGFLGRTAVAELLDMSDRIRQMILERLPAAEIKQAAREEGMTFLRESALEKVFAGVTTLREINKVTFFSNPGDPLLRGLLENARRIAVVGLSPKPHRDSNRVARYLLESGYEVVPVYPREETILGQRVHRSLADIPAGVDLVDVFRRSETLAGVVDDALAAKAPALWFQLGCVDEAAAQRAQQAGALVVMDRCLMVEHRRLLGPGWKRSK